MHRVMHRDCVEISMKLERHWALLGLLVKSCEYIADNRHPGGLAIRDAAQARYGYLHVVITRVSKGVLNLKAVRARSIPEVPVTGEHGRLRRRSNRAQGQGFSRLCVVG